MSGQRARAPGDRLLETCPSCERVITSPSFVVRYETSDDGPRTIAACPACKDVVTIE